MVGRNWRFLILIIVERSPTLGTNNRVDHWQPTYANFPGNDFSKQRIYVQQSCGRKPIVEEHTCFNQILNAELAELDGRFMDYAGNVRMKS